MKDVVYFILVNVFTFFLMVLFIRGLDRFRVKLGLSRRLFVTLKRCIIAVFVLYLIIMSFFFLRPRVFLSEDYKDASNISLEYDVGNPVTSFDNSSLEHRLRRKYKKMSREFDDDNKRAIDRFLELK